jgi:four helix bundle protein
MKKFDLEERTAIFGQAVIIFAKKIPVNEISRSLINQLIRSATSIGANYLEADDSESARDFIHKLSICKKESRETKHWLRMIVVADQKSKAEARKLWTEAQELNLIFAAIIHKKQSK